MLFTKIVEVEKEVKVVDEVKVKELEKELRAATDEVAELKAELRQTKLDFASERRIAENEIELKINEATASKEKENVELLQKNAVLNSRVVILEKAFENMGFDVKDMKDILNKLVDGIVSKNEVNVIR